MSLEPLTSYELPDGRIPIRFDRGRAAYYPKKRGTGEVRYLFSMIKYIQNNRPLKSKEEISKIRKIAASAKRSEDPNYFADIGKKGGSITKKQRKQKVRKQMHIWDSWVTGKNDS